MKHIGLAILFGLMAVGLMGAVIAASSAQAQPNALITVNSTLDEVDVTPGDGLCVSTPSGQCTLRAAIMEANALAGADVINVPAGVYSLTIVGNNEDTGATGDLDVYSELALNGAGPNVVVIDGNQLDRVFHVSTSTVTVTLSGLTIQGGNPGFLLGGGVLNSGRLFISNSIVARNTNAGISNGATLVMTDSQLISNTIAGLYNVGLSASVDHSVLATNAGAGLYNTGVLTVTDSVITGNTARGVYNSIVSTTNRLTLIRSTVVSNTTLSNGGGIFNGGTLSVINSSVVSNTSNGDGGGIYVFTLSRTTLVNTTISSNRATGNGGGLVFASGGYAPPDLYNVTLTDNVADSNTDGAGDGGGIYNGSLLHEPIVMTNTLLANNTDTGGQVLDCAGDIWPQDYNLIQSTVGCIITGTGAHNIIGQAPNLGPLQDNGGPTLTHALLPGSPAIDAGDPAGCKDALGNLLMGDQRGFIRAADGDSNGSVLCDIGAFEYGSIPFLQLFLPLILR